MSISYEGVFVIINKASSTALELNSEGTNGKPEVQASQLVYNNKYQFWLLQKAPTTVNGYHFVNMTSGTAMNLLNGNTENGTPVYGSPFEQNNPSQIWFLNNIIDDLFTIRNSKSNTVLDLKDGDKSNGTPVQGWTQLDSNPHQGWKLIRIKAGERGIGVYREEIMHSVIFV